MAIGPSPTRSMARLRAEYLLQKEIQRVLRNPRFRFWKDFTKRFPKGEAYLVGGAIRDMVMGRTTKDLDFIVRNVPVTLLQTFLRRYGQVDLVGKRFGVLKFIPKGWEEPPRASLAFGGEPLDIALPRTDHSFNLGGYKDVVAKSNPRLPIEDDLARRDFTVNAIAVRIKNPRTKAHALVRGRQESRIKNYTIVDPFHGLVDIQKKVLRTVGEPRARFREDYSRLLRGLRFACQLGFVIEKNTWGATKKFMPQVNGKRRIIVRASRASRESKRAGTSRQARSITHQFIVPRETIGRELIKAFVADPVRAFDLWNTSGATKVVLPEILPMKRCPQPKQFHAEGDVWAHTRLALTHLVSPAFRRRFPDIDAKSAIAVFAIFLHDIGKPKTLRTPSAHGTDRIRFDGHDMAGAAMAAKIVERLRLPQFPKDDVRHHVDGAMLVWLIRYHMLFNEKIVRAMKATTIERYFLKDHYRGRLFQAFAWVDMAASVPARGKQTWKPLRIVERRVRLIARRLRRMRVRPLLNGDAIMQRFTLRSSPFIGQLLDALREEQLQGRVQTKPQAWDFLKTKV